MTAPITTAPITTAPASPAPPARATGEPAATTPGPRLTPRGRAAAGGGAVLAVLGTLTGWPEVVAMGLTALVAVALCLPFVVRPPGITFERRLTADRVTVGGRAHALVMVTRTGRFGGGSLDATDRVGEGVDETQVPIAVPHLALGETRRVPYEVFAPRRGRLPLGPIEIVRRDPLGLLARRSEGEKGWLWIHPRTHRLRAVPVGLDVDLEGSLRSPVPRGSITFSTLREYVPGDDVRRIHWPATARTGIPMVREQMDTSRPRATVLLDRRADAWTPSGFEHGVEVAASVAVAMVRAGEPVTVAVDDEPWLAHPSAGSGPILDRLTLATVSDDAGRDHDGPDRPDPFVDLARRQAGGTLVVVTGGEREATAVRVAALTRHYGFIIVCHVDPDGRAPRVERRGSVMVIRGTSSRLVADAWNRVIAG